MPSDLVVHGFETSNNMKVRVALGYKKISYEFRAIDPADRSEIVRLSGQRLTPVVQHGDVVLFDSAAIIRYLEANFRDRPGLLGDGRDEQWAIEELELFARAVLAAPMTELVHHRVAGGHVDDAMRERCQREFAAAAAKLAAKLGDRSWLVGEAMSLADVTAAAVVYRVRTGGLFELPTETETLSGWVDRVMSYDRHLGPAT